MLKNPIPVIVIEVPALPTVGEIDVTDPIVHGVKRNSSGLLVGTDCEHEDGLISELEPHDETGIESIIKNNNENILKNDLEMIYLLMYNKVVDQYN